MFAAFKMMFVYLVLGSIASVLGVPYSILIGDIGPLYRVALWIMRVGVSAGGIRVEVHGLQNALVGQSCIFMCNHVSNLDPPVLMPYLPGRSSVLLKKSLTQVPFLGTAMRLAKFVPVQRGQNVEAARASIAAAGEALQSGLNILVFPEGTRSRDGRLSAFKKGPFYLAAATAAPIVPIAISGTQAMLRKGSWALASGVAHIRFLPSIDPAAHPTRESLVAAVRSAINTALPAEMKMLPDES